MSDSAAPTAIVLPSFDASMQEGSIVSWRVSVGETVRAGQVIADVETDKAMVELEATVDGVIESLEVPEGGPPVTVGTTIARLRVADSPAGTGRRTSEPAHEECETSPPAFGVAGTRAPQPPSTTDHGPEQAPPREATATTAQPAGSRRIPASPRARRLARERGLSLERVTGSGPCGRIVIGDLESAPDPAHSVGQSGFGSTADPSRPTSVSPELSALGYAAGSYVLTPLTGMRTTIARRLTQSFRDVPHFSLTTDVELDRVMHRRKALDRSSNDNGAAISINDFFVWACAAALQDVPDANVSFTADGIARHRHADIAVAVAVEGGLVTPVVREAESRSIEDIAAEMKRLAELARARRLERADMEGGTFTVSNLGMYGIRSFTSVLNPSQACILSVGAADQRPVFYTGGFSIVNVATMTLTCDHRAVDGVIGSRFLAALRERLATA